MMRSTIFVFLLMCCARLFAAETVSGERFQNRSNDLRVPLGTAEQVYENSPALCIDNDTCDLRKIIFRKEDYEIPAISSIKNDETIRSTRILAGFLVDEVEDLTKYSFVQFTRGCMWYSWVSNAGGPETEYGVIRDFLGISNLQHIFPNWVVDSVDTDPAFGSDAFSGNRHYFLQFAGAIPAWIPTKKGKLYGEERPTFPFGYVTDATGPAFYGPGMGIATNMSLEFRMCLFKTQDVPTHTNGIDVDQDKAITCFRWESKHVFDHHAGVFRSPAGIHSECRRPFNAREKNFHLEQLEKGEQMPPNK